MPELLGEEALESIFLKYRGKGKKYDCILMYSGGRDSCYAAHQIVKKYMMKPLLVTFDWGMMTKFAQENWSRTKKILNVDHCVIRLNHQKILSDIQKNVHAFLKKPRVHMFPLFTGADKSMDVEISKLAKKLEIPLVISAGGGGYEKTLFKKGFFGIYGGSLLDILKLGTKISFEFIRNPRYFNSFFFTGFLNFFYYLFSRHRKVGVEYIHFYHYIKWNEDIIVSTIQKELEWVSPPNTDLTWRTDDGTAPFYNYIHLKLAGFTENDTLRSIQIREGDITREEGLQRAKKDNQPRYNEGNFSIKSYCDRIGVPYDYTIRTIESAPRYYD